jgi:hypothetical protein
MSEKKPPPLIPARVRNLCPVCGKTSYSRAGIHPQCSVRQADEESKIRVKRERLLAEDKRTGAPVSGLSPWHKSCPKCHTLQHVRKTVCACGHTFTVL